MAWGKVTLLWKHVLANLVASSVDADFPVSNILSRREDIRYLASSTTTPIYIYPGSGPGGGDALTADYFFVHGHNLNTIGAQIMLQYSNDNFSADINDAWDHNISEFATSVFDAGATNPGGIDYAPDGTLWICDFSTDKIYNVELDGTWISEFATSVFDVGATSPQGISYASDGTLWICDLNTRKIYNVELDGTWISEFATSVFDIFAFSPTGISYASDGTLWICDDSSSKIYNVELDGTGISEFATSVFDPFMSRPTGIDYASDGTLWICAGDTDKIYNVETDGTSISSFPTSFFDASATSPQSISYASDGTLWICDKDTDKIYNVSLPLLPNNKTFAQRFDSVSADYWRLKITGTLSAVPQIAICYWGERAEISRCTSSFDPNKRRTEGNIHKTQGGIIAGIHEKYRERGPITYNFGEIDADGQEYADLDEWDLNIGRELFGLMWEPDEHPTETYLMHNEKGDFDMPLTRGGSQRRAKITLTGRMEE
jgi:sugar lactone lactonase YvrE